MTERAKGIWAMIEVCVIWGLSPIYYHAIRHVPPGEVLAHRTLWSLALFGIILALQRRLPELGAALTSRRLPVIALAALMISANWLLFIWSVQAGRVVESSLGYYIFPLVAVCLGVVVFRERLRPAQIAAVGLAAVAVVTLTLGLGAAPWVALGLAFTFGLYGVLKKGLPLGPVLSVGAEVAVLAPIAALWLIFAGGAAFGADAATTALLIGSGALTAVPLILFSYATRRVELATIGLMQYLNPTLQFLCAVVVFAEPFTGWHMIAFALIWSALALYTASGLRGRQRPLAKPAGPV